MHVILWYIRIIRNFQNVLEINEFWNYRHIYVNSLSVKSNKFCCNFKNILFLLIKFKLTLSVSSQSVPCLLPMVNWTQQRENNLSWFSYSPCHCVFLSWDLPTWHSYWWNDESIGTKHKGFLSSNAGWNFYHICNIKFHCLVRVYIDIQRT